MTVCELVSKELRHGWICINAGTKYVDSRWMKALKIEKAHIHQPHRVYFDGPSSAGGLLGCGGVDLDCRCCRNPRQG